MAKRYGFTKVSQVVKEHMELKSISRVPREKEVVYLADKMVDDDKIVTINEKFSSKEKMYENNYEALNAVKYRKKQAMEIYNLIYSEGETYENN